MASNISVRRRVVKRLYTLQTELPVLDAALVFCRPFHRNVTISERKKTFLERSSAVSGRLTVGQQRLRVSAGAE